MKKPIRLGFLASGGGTNMQAIIDACTSGRLKADPVVVISNNSQSGALAKARNANISAYHLSAKTHPMGHLLDRMITAVLENHRVDYVILAGYMKKLGPMTLDSYRGKILNIHPSLLPKYGGQGMYGSRVHEAVLAAGERETGITIHLIDSDYDTGPIVAQCRVPVLPDDTIESLAARVLQQEHRFYVETLNRIVSGDINLSQIVKNIGGR